MRKPWPTGAVAPLKKNIIYRFGSTLQVVHPCYVPHALPSLSLLDLITLITVSEEYKSRRSVKKQRENSHLEDTSIE
jgi:hypothetical protein